MTGTDWRTLHEIERDVILARLEAFNRDKPATAKSLGIALKTLYNKLNAYQLQEAMLDDLIHSKPGGEMMTRYVKTDPDEPDWSLVMDLCEVRARQEKDPEHRARLQRKWREAYFKVEQQRREWACVVPALRGETN